MINSVHELRPGLPPNGRRRGGAHPSSAHRRRRVLLQEVDVNYPLVQLRGVTKHTVDTVLGLLAKIAAPASGELRFAPAADEFLGYLLLDAVVMNCDRSHENWGMLQLAGGVRRLAPNYDHASSLGRELQDSDRQDRLTTLAAPSSTTSAEVARVSSPKIPTKRPSVRRTHSSARSANVPTPARLSRPASKLWGKISSKKSPPACPLPLSATLGARSLTTSSSSRAGCSSSPRDPQIQG